MSTPNYTLNAVYRIMGGYKNSIYASMTSMLDLVSNDITNKFSMLCLYQAAIAAEMSQYKEDNK